MSSGVGSTYTMTGSNGKDGGSHFSEEELLAYLEQRDHRDERWLMMQQHIATCAPCFKLLGELEQAERLLRETYTSNVYSFYPSITNIVIEKASGPQSTLFHPLAGQRRREPQGRKRTVLFPIAAMLVAACIFLLAVVLLKPPSSIGSKSSHSTPTVPLTATVHIKQHPTPKPTAAPVTPAPTSASGSPTVPGSGGLAIGNCTTGLDEAEHHLRICGSGWTPGDKVMLVLVDKNNSIMKRFGSVQIQTDGTFSQNISIHSCKDVPWAVYAEDTTLPGEQVQTLYNIYYGSC